MKFNLLNHMLNRRSLRSLSLRSEPLRSAPLRQLSLRALFSLSLFGAAIIASPAYANDPDTIDQLTQQWLDTDRQASHLQSDWLTQKPVLEQRLTLLKAEKDQLQTILQASNNDQNTVETRREELLATQSKLEQQQQALIQTLDLLLSRIETLGQIGRAHV